MEPYEFVDASDEPGPWSEVEGFVVNPLPPASVSPDNGTKFTQRLPPEGIEFKWRAAAAGTRYLFEVTDANGSVFKRTVKGTSVTWRPTQPGAYNWRVGYEAPNGGEEWGKFRSFSATPLAIDGEAPKPIIKQVFVEKKVPVKDSDAYREADVRPSEWSLTQNRVVEDSTPASSRRLV